LDDSFSGALHEGVDLVLSCRRSEIPPVAFRDEEIGRVVDHLDRNRSVLVVGNAGVGKTSVVHGVAHAFAARKRTLLRQLSTAQMMTGTKYIGEWETKIGAIFERAGLEDTVVYWTDVWNMASAGRSAQTTLTMLDALRPRLESKEVRILAEATPEILRTMSRVPQFASLFEAVEIAPLSDTKVDAIVERACDALTLDIDAGARRTLTTLTSRFLAARAQPGPALHLVRQVHDYLAQKRGVDEDEEPSSEFVEKVFSIYSGLPRFVVSRSTTKPTHEIKRWFEDRIVGQREAVQAVVETIALFKAGLHDPDRPIGTFLFVGPTGVGKTELARKLASFLFGSAHRLLRFDLSEFKDYSSFELLIGNPNQPEQPARLLDPVRSQPFQVILLDELEKAHQNVWDLLLPLLDDGTLTPPGGSPVNFRNTIVIATSNVGARESDKSLGFGGDAGSDARSGRFRDSLEQHFRPELLNRFQHVVVFHHLSKEHVRRVARQELDQILKREGIVGRNLVVDVDESALDHVIASGFDHRYGARALKREIQRQLVLPLAVALMERDIGTGAIIRLLLEDRDVKVKVIDTPESRQARKDAELSVRTGDGEKIDRSELRLRLRQIPDRIQALSTGADESFARDERDRLLGQRQAPNFWADVEAAALATRDLDRYSMMIGRFERFRHTLRELDSELKDTMTKSELARAASRLVSLERSIDEAHREMIRIGRTGARDVLIEVKPGGGATTRNLLVETYLGWARWKRLDIDWLLEPLEDTEPVFLAVSGPYALGYLSGESGVHRTRNEDEVAIATVRVAAWLDRREAPDFMAQRALKLAGQFGGKIRSRVETTLGLALQNARTLAENRDLAAEIVPSWGQASNAGDEIVRRYDLAPFKVRDAVTGFSSGHPDALKPKRFHDLLCRRVDATTE